MQRRHFLQLISVAPAAFAATPYTGPRPPAKDIPYLKEATRLVSAEVQKAAHSKSKHGSVLSVPGVTSSARTPIPEPIFLFASEKINADTLELAHFTVQDGKRQVATGGKKSDDDDDEPVYHLTLRKVDNDLYEIEAAEMLDPGEYALSPQGSDTAFCFTVY